MTGSRVLYTRAISRQSTRNAILSLSGSARSARTAILIWKKSWSRYTRCRTVDRKSTTVSIADLTNKVGKTVAIEGEIAQIKQTSGPTIFTIVDETGTQNAAAFVEAGVRAYPEAELDDIVKIIGEVMMRNNQLQIEVDSLSILRDEDAAAVKIRIEKALDARSEPENIPLLVQSEVMEKLRPEMKKVAKIIRKAIFTSQPIILAPPCRC